MQEIEKDEEEQKKGWNITGMPMELSNWVITPIQLGYKSLK